MYTIYLTSYLPAETQISFGGTAYSDHPARSSFVGVLVTIRIVENRSQKIFESCRKLRKLANHVVSASENQQSPVESRYKVLWS